jgi:hypothetical protein
VAVDISIAAAGLWRVHREDRAEATAAIKMAQACQRPPPEQAVKVLLVDLEISVPIMVVVPEVARQRSAVMLVPTLVVLVVQAQRSP